MDTPGIGTFDATPPERLSPDCVLAWNELCKRVPIASLTKTDELAVEICATLLAMWWLTREIKVQQEIRAWFGKLGMTPVDRTRIPMPPKPPGGNSFADL